MAFKVRFSEAQDKLNDYDRGDVYSFVEDGVLCIAYAAKKAKWTEYDAPGTWAHVVAEARHMPGQSGYSTTADIHDIVYARGVSLATSNSAPTVPGRQGGPP